MADRKDDSSTPAWGEKRPYEPPEVVETAVFETLALGCKLSPGESAACDFIGPQFSS